MLLDHPLCRLFGHDNKIFVLFQLPCNPAIGSHIAIDLSVDQRREKGSPDVLHAFQCLVIIIDIDQPRRHGLVIHFFERQLQSGMIIQIDRNQTVVQRLLIRHGFRSGHIAKRNAVCLQQIGMLLELHLLRQVFPRILRQQTFFDCGKNSGDHPSVALLEMSNPLKGDIHPYRPAVLI